MTCRRLKSTAIARDLEEHFGGSLGDPTTTAGAGRGIYRRALDSWTIDTERRCQLTYIIGRNRLGCGCVGRSRKREEPVVCDVPAGYYAPSLTGSLTTGQAEGKRR